MQGFFNRKTFDPINNPIEAKVLETLRTQGRSRFTLYKNNNPKYSTAMKWAIEEGINRRIPCKTFIDLGCGDSPDRLIASDKGFQATGFDLFPPSFNRGNFKQLDVAETLPIADASIDMAISQAMVDLIEPVARTFFLSEVKRVMSATSIFACSLVWLQSGWGFDLNEEYERAEYVFGKIQRKPSGFIATKEVL